MSNLYSTSEELQRMRQRYEQWAQAGFPGADPLVIPWVKLMAQLPGVVPVSSCEGHVAVYPTVRDSQQLLWNGMYFLWAIDETGADVIRELYRRLGHSLHGLCPAHWWSNLFTLHYYRNIDFDEQGQIDYGCCPLHVAPMMPEQGKRIQRALGEVLEGMVKDFHTYHPEVSCQS